MRGHPMACMMACISKGIDNMHDKDIFKAEEVMDESNIYEWNGLSVV